MTTKLLITVLLLMGYVVALPALLWGLGDLKRIPGGVWRHGAQRPRAQWRTGMISAYGLGGWPLFVSVVVWRRSRERADLLDEWAHLSRRKRLARLAREAARSDAEPVVVLSELETEPEAAPEREAEREDA
jgi:hypothetical protein